MIFFLFRLLPLGVATAESPPPFCSLLCVFLRHFHCRHVLSHRIHKPPFKPSPCSLSWQLHRQHPSPNILSIFPQCMSKPPQSCPHVLSFHTVPNLRCPSDVPYSFLILSILATPNENLSIFNSATSSSTSCLFFSIDGRLLAGHNRVLD